MTQDTITKLTNYQGNNSFLIKMKESFQKYGNLTPNQLTAVEKILGKPSPKSFEELPEEVKEIALYNGNNKFLIDIKTKLIEKRSLSEKQIEVAIKQNRQEKDKNRKVTMKVPTIGETIKIGRKVGTGLKEKYSLKFNPILIDITKVLALTPKSVLFSGKMTIKRGDVCMICAKTLTDEFSMLTRMGKTCAKHLKVDYITDSSQAERFRNEYLKKVNEIGEMEFWVPISQIVKWDGDSKVILDIVHV